MRAPDAQAAAAAAAADATDVAAGPCPPGHHLLSYTDFTSATKL